MRATWHHATISQIGETIMRCKYTSDKGVRCQREAYQGGLVCSDCAHKVHHRIFGYLAKVHRFGFAMELDTEFGKVYGKVG